EIRARAAESRRLQLTWSTPECSRSTCPQDWMRCQLSLSALQDRQASTEVSDIDQGLGIGISPRRRSKRPPKLATLARHTDGTRQSYFQRETVSKGANGDLREHEYEPRNAANLADHHMLQPRLSHRALTSDRLSFAGLQAKMRAKRTPQQETSPGSRNS